MSMHFPSFDRPIKIICHVPFPFTQTDHRIPRCANRPTRNHNREPQTLIAKPIRCPYNYHVQCRSFILVRRASHEITLPLNKHRRNAADKKTKSQKQKAKFPFSVKARRVGCTSQLLTQHPQYPTSLTAKNHAIPDRSQRNCLKPHRNTLAPRPLIYEHWFRSRP